MSVDSAPVVERDGARREVSAWSEDPLAAQSRAIWTSADFLPIARSFEAGAREFVQRLTLQPGEKVLDVACGTGNLAIPAARAGATVTGIDIAENLIAEARLEAHAANCAIRFDVGNAETMPYMDGQFDTTVSMFGAMFAARPERVASELLRVTRSGGRLAMANWTPAGFVGQMLRAHVAVAPPASGAASPLDWGVEAIVQSRLGARVSSLRCTTRMIELRFPFPPAAVTELFASNYGPTVMTLRKLDPEWASRLRRELTRLFSDYNMATDGTTVVLGEFLDVQADLS